MNENTSCLVVNMAKQRDVVFDIMLQGFSASLFLALGWLAKNVSVPRWIYILLICCWPLALAFSTLDMYACYYKYFPLDVLGACGVLSSYSI